MKLRIVIPALLLTAALAPILQATPTSFLDEVTSITGISNSVDPNGIIGTGLSGSANFEPGSYLLIPHYVEVSLAVWAPTTTIINAVQSVPYLENFNWVYDGPPGVYAFDLHYSLAPSEVPEPATTALVGLGLAGYWLADHVRRSRKL